MKKFWFTAALVFFVFLTTPIYSQILPWSAPQLLCDSIGDNLNPTFARYEYEVIYNVLLWERDYGDHSQIYLKNFGVPDSEIVISPDIPNVYSKNPSASYFFNSGYEFDALIVWQSNVNGNFDLYSAFYDSGVIKAYQQITSNPGDDLNPYLFDDILVWERKGNIYLSRYSIFDSTWSNEFLIDSLHCRHPVAIWNQVVYEKGNLTRGYRIFKRKKDYNQNWLEPECIFSDGDNHFPFFGDFYSSIIWQHKNQSDWNIMSWSNTDTSILIFSNMDETHPVGLDIPLITTNYNNFWASMFLAFESNINGQSEIYVHDLPWDYQGCYNISQNNGPDRNPSFSSSAWEEPINYSVRYWLAWESFRDGKWQIWGSFSEMVTDIDDHRSDNYLTKYQLYQNYPNPFNPTTTISYQLTQGARVELTIYNLLGQKIRSLVNSRQPAGFYQVEWDGNDNTEREVSSGVYIYHIKVRDFVQSKKMLLIR